MGRKDKDKEKLEEQRAEQVSSDIVDALDGFILPRNELTSDQFFQYPLDLNGTAEETGLPFMKFGFAGSNGTHRVAIFLYQPPGVSINDSVNYTSMNIGTIQGGIGLVKNLAKGKLFSAGDTAALGLMGKDKLLTPGSSIDKLTSGAALRAGVATNPYTRTAYESTNVRSFSFSFRLVAESAKEQNQIRNIERTFRKFLYPKRGGAVALIYPPLCDITFYSEGGRNEYMPNIKPSYLTSLEAIYNETATAMHKGTGAPIELSLNLTFQEERVLTRDDLYRSKDGTVDDNEILESDGFAKGINSTITSGDNA